LGLSAWDDSAAFVRCPPAIFLFVPHKKDFRLSSAARQQKNFYLACGGVGLMRMVLLCLKVECKKKIHVKS